MIFLRLPRYSLAELADYQVWLALGGEYIFCLICWQLRFVCASLKLQREGNVKVCKFSFYWRLHAPIGDEIRHNHRDVHHFLSLILHEPSDRDFKSKQMNLTIRLIGHR
jgi:hypothetical protein